MHWSKNNAKSVKYDMCFVVVDSSGSVEMTASGGASDDVAVDDSLVSTHTVPSDDNIVPSVTSSVSVIVGATQHVCTDSSIASPSTVGELQCGAGRHISTAGNDGAVILTVSYPPLKAEAVTDGERVVGNAADNDAMSRTADDMSDSSSVDIAQTHRSILCRILSFEFLINI